MSDYKKDIIKVPKFSESNGFYTTKERSDLMKKIKATNTKPELKLRKFLWGLGIRYRKNVKFLPGKPDIAIAKYKLTIFIDGEFWHGRDWREKKEKIKSNRGFWIPKIERNIQRDRMVDDELVSKGWTVMRFWESEIKKEFSICVNKILLHIDEFNDLSRIKGKNP